MGLIFLAIDKLWLDLYGNYVVYYTMKIINLRTGKVKTKKPKVLPKCEICDTNVEDDGISGKIGYLPVSFCGICTLGIVNMLVERGNEYE